MRVRIEYKQGGGFEVEADDADDLELLTNMALKILWGKSTEAMSLDETAEWLGWKR